MPKQRGRYDYCTDIKATIFGMKDEEVVLFHDFECEVEIDIAIFDSSVIATCGEVFIDGHALQHGDHLAHFVRSQVTDAVEAELEAAGPIWDKVREAEGLTMIGQPGDPDARWVR